MLLSPQNLVSYPRLMYLGIDVGFSRTVRSTGICVIDPAALKPVRCVHITTHGTIQILADLMQNRQPLAVSLNGPLIRARAGTKRFRIARRYRSCERLLSGGIFQKRCKPGPTNSPRGFALHQQSTAIANHLLRTFPDILIQEAFPNAFLGVLLPASVYQGPIRRGIKSDVFWEHCLRKGLLADLVNFLFKNEARKIFKSAASLKDHDERAAFICALSARGAEMQVNSLVGGGTDGTIALPPKQFIQPWAWDTLIERGALHLSRPGSTPQAIVILEPPRRSTTARSLAAVTDPPSLS